MKSKGFNFEDLELTEEQSIDARDYVSDMQVDINEKSAGEQLRKLFKDTDLTLGQKIYIAYIFGRTEDVYRNFLDIKRDTK